MTSIWKIEPPPLKSYAPHAPAELQQIISKALRKDRVSNGIGCANQFLEALKDLRHKLEFEAELERATAAPLWRRWARSPTALAITLLVAALAVVLPFYRQRNLPASLPLDKSIAVLPLANLSEDKGERLFRRWRARRTASQPFQNPKDLKVISRTSVIELQERCPAEPQRNRAAIGCQ